MKTTDSISAPIDLGELLKVVRAAGAAKFSGFGISVEFAPTPGEVSDPKPAPTDVATDTCRCGHAVYEHTNGFCHHCDPEKCVDAAKAS